MCFKACGLSYKNKTKIQKKTFQTKESRKNTTYTYKYIYIYLEKLSVNFKQKQSN